MIRAFKRQAWFIRRNEYTLDDNNAAFFALKAVDRWLSTRLELLGIYYKYMWLLTKLCVVKLAVHIIYFFDLHV